MGNKGDCKCRQAFLRLCYMVILFVFHDSERCYIRYGYLYCFSFEFSQNIRIFANRNGLSGIDRHNFTLPDQFVALNEENGMLTVGHFPIWRSRCPDDVV